MRGASEGHPHLCLHTLDVQNSVRCNLTRMPLCVTGTPPCLQQASSSPSQVLVCGVQGTGRLPILHTEPGWRPSARTTPMPCEGKGGALLTPPPHLLLPLPAPAKIDMRAKVEASAPQHFFCPIAMHIMRDPVVLSTGQTCEAWGVGSHRRGFGRLRAGNPPAHTVCPFAPHAPDHTVQPCKHPARVPVPPGTTIPASSAGCRRATPSAPSQGSSCRRL